MMQLVSKRLAVAALVAANLLFAVVLAAQSAGNGSVSGTVTDPSGAVVANTQVELQNPVSGFSRAVTSDSTGKFSFPNVPFNDYHFTVKAQGFASHVEDVSVRSVVPVNLNIALTVSASAESVTVEATAVDLLETTSTFHTDIDQKLLAKLPLESVSSSVSAQVTMTTPGIAADSNGKFHGL